MERPQRVRPIGTKLTELPPKAKAREMDQRYPQSKQTLLIAFVVTLLLHVLVGWAAWGKVVKREVILYFDMSQKYEMMPVPPHKPREAAPAPEGAEPGAP